MYCATFAQPVRRAGTSSSRSALPLGDRPPRLLTRDGGSDECGEVLALGSFGFISASERSAQRDPV